MISNPQLSIRLAAGQVRSHLGHAEVGEYFGGPETLLHWLETQLGLPVARVPHACRISEFAAALDATNESAFAASLKADRWATASELLSRRDELLLAGWEEADSEAHPAFVRALARVAKDRTFQFPGEAARLRQVLEALDAGQVLPPHRCSLHDGPDAWPPLWRSVLARLTLAEPPSSVPSGPAGSALHMSQTALLGATMGRISFDETFRHVRTRSQSSAVEFVAAALARVPDKLSRTVVCCEDDALALRLDACLNRVGLPTTGAAVWSHAHPVLQVLPLSLALGWDPVDPQALLDFLMLPVLPIPRKAASRLAEALTREPGLGSSEWNVAKEEVCAEADDPEKMRERLKAWFGGERAARGGEMPSRLVRIRCGMVAQWAAGRAALLIKEGDERSELVEALQVAAGQATLLGELAESQGTALSEPQLERLLEEARADGMETRPFIEADGGPVRVRSLSEIDGPCDRLIWLGVGTADASGCRWSADQFRMLRDAGVGIADGSKRLASLRAAEARGYGLVKEAFLAVALPQDLEKRWHPLWLALRALLPESEHEQTPVLEDVIASGDTASLSPFSFECRDTDVEPGQKARALWNIPSSLLVERDNVSATELQDRLACPFKWTLHYQARLRPSPIAQLPDEQAWHWFGTLSVAPDGRCDACWYDTRNDPSSTFSELYYTFSRDGGATWSPNMAVSPPFDHSLGYPVQRKMGDYIGMVSLNEAACIAYTATFNGEEDIYFLRIDLPIIITIVRDPAGIALSWRAIPGRRYCVQSKDSLIEPWPDVYLDCLTASTATAMFVDNLAATNSHRFYRVVEEP